MLIPHIHYISVHALCIFLCFIYKEYDFWEIEKQCDPLEGSSAPLGNVGVRGSKPSSTVCNGAYLVPDTVVKGFTCIDSSSPLLRGNSFWVPPRTGKLRNSGDPSWRWNTLLCFHFAHLQSLSILVHFQARSRSDSRKAKPQEDVGFSSRWQARLLLIVPTAIFSQLLKPVLNCSFNFKSLSESPSAEDFESENVPKPPFSRNHDD